MNYLSGLAYEVGEEADIDDLASLSADEELRNLLLRFGIEKYRKSALLPHELAERSIVKTLEQAKVVSGEIDAMIYATSTFDQGKFSQAGILEMLQRLSLPAYPYGIFLSECTHALAALELASSLLDSGKAKQVLVVTTDSFEGRGRRIEPELGIGSDGAASYIASKIPSHLALDGVVMGIDLSMKEWGNQMPSDAEVQARAAVIRSLCERTYQKYGLTASGIDALITNNFHLGAIRSLCALAGQNGSKAFTGTVGEYAHVYASDVIINLASLLAAKPMAAGAKIMLLATGSYTFASAIITATGQQSGQ